MTKTFNNKTGYIKFVARDKMNRNEIKMIESEKKEMEMTSMLRNTAHLSNLPEKEEILDEYQD